MWTDLSLKIFVFVKTCSLFLFFLFVCIFFFIFFFFLFSVFFLISQYLKVNSLFVWFCFDEHVCHCFVNWIAIFLLCFNLLINSLFRPYQHVSHVVYCHKYENPQQYAVRIQSGQNNTCYIYWSTKFRQD